MYYNIQCNKLYHRKEQLNPKANTLDTTEAVHLKGVYVKRHPMNYVIFAFEYSYEKKFIIQHHIFIF